MTNLIGPRNVSDRANETAYYDLLIRARHDALAMVSVMGYTNAAHVRNIAITLSVLAPNHCHVAE